ncbi:MAG TPA: hypothetical protein VGC34_06770 [Steroidobacteraceae bacterium]
MDRRRPGVDFLRLENLDVDIPPTYAGLTRAMLQSCRRGATPS